MPTNTPRSVTLLCSAAATGLSRTASLLHDSYGLRVVDLEEVIKDEVIDWSRYPDDPHNMATICSEEDRDTVLTYWRQAFDQSIASLADNQDGDSHAVLACHLTLFSPSRLEMYSPPLLGCILSTPEIQVDRVVVLIDDIYDMYSRLSGPGHLYDPDTSAYEHRVHVRKLTGPMRDDEKVREFTTAEEEAVTLEAHVKNLLRLLHWRRSEMIAAEELARNLSVGSEGATPLNVLGVKHQAESLRALIMNDALPIYISHKITEPRRENQRAALDGNAHRWDPLVPAVNSLSAELRNFNIIAIQPTAIDELRFNKRYQYAWRLGRYASELSDRWSIPTATMYQAPPDQTIFPSRVLSGYERGTVGLLQHSIYDEIAFRDHLLVSCNQGLLIYRPGAIEARISGGVEEEVAHWGQSVLSDSRPARPAAFIHVADELAALLHKAEKPSVSATLRSGFLSSLRQFTSDDRQLLWKAFVDDVDLVEVSQRGSAHLRRATPGSLEDRIRGAVAMSIYRLMSELCKVDGRLHDEVAHFVASSAEMSTDADFLRGVAEYLHDSTPAARLEVNRAAAADFVHMTFDGTESEFVRLLASLPSTQP